MTRMRAFCGLVLLYAGCVHAAYDANDVALGASEKAVLKQFPTRALRAAAMEEQGGRAALRRLQDRARRRARRASPSTSSATGSRPSTCASTPRTRSAWPAFLKKRYGAPAEESRANLESAAAPTLQGGMEEGRRARRAHFAEARSAAPRSRCGAATSRTRSTASARASSAPRSPWRRPRRCRRRCS